MRYVIGNRSQSTTRRWIGRRATAAGNTRPLRHSVMEGARPVLKRVDVRLDFVNPVQQGTESQQRAFLPALKHGEHCGKQQHSLGRNSLQFPCLRLIGTCMNHLCLRRLRRLWRLRNLQLLLL